MNDKGKTKIPYVTQTWETVGGCSKCSVGCRECYAIRQIWRLAHNPVTGDRYKGLVEKLKFCDIEYGKYQWTGNIKLFEDRLDQPLHWKAPRTIFVNPRSDLFHDAVPFEFVDKMCASIALCPQHKFLMLTKRPEKMLEYFKIQRPRIYFEALKLMTKPEQKQLFNGFPLPNVIHMTTICNQAEADKNVPYILQIKGKLGLSIEPMLERVRIRHPEARGRSYRDWDWINYIDWVVIGCESGPNRRPCKIEWMIDLVQQCQAAGVRCYVKQVSINGKVVKDINKFPKLLQVRETIFR